MPRPIESLDFNGIRLDGSSVLCRLSPVDEDVDSVDSGRRSSWLVWDTGSVHSGLGRVASAPAKDVLNSVAEHVVLSSRDSIACCEGDSTSQVICWVALDRGEGRTASIVPLKLIGGDGCKA